MTMETTDYVSYPLALALKAAGFDVPCNYGYSVKLRLGPEVSFGNPKMVHSKTPKNYNDNSKGIEKGLEFCSAPTLWQAQKWLRNMALLHVGANPALPTRQWWFYIDDLNQHVNPHDGELMTRWDDDMQAKADEQLYESYEQALSAGIEAALKLLDNEKE